MNNKPYSWKAIYNDKSSFEQFTSDGTENVFGDIDLEELDVFIISSSTDINAFQVNVNKGVFSVNGQIIYFGEYSSNRLIYFRRNRVNLGVDFISDSDVVHCFGIQATVNGVNKKLIFGVSESTGRVFFIDN